MDYRVNLPVFEGPFDLLYHLVKKAEVDIWDISVAQITGQYLDYLDKMQTMNLDVTSEFLLLAAALLRLKSRALLPAAPEVAADEEDVGFMAIATRDQLVERLLEYRLFKQKAAVLAAREEQQKKIFFRRTGSGQNLRAAAGQQSFYSGDVMALVRFWQDYYKRRARRELVLAPLEEATVADRLRHIIARLNRRRTLTFSDLCHNRSRTHISATFLALLELNRQQRVRIWQKELFGRILITKN